MRLPETAAAAITHDLRWSQPERTAPQREVYANRRHRAIQRRTSASRVLPLDGLAIV
jgi:hypothetical protein